MAQSKQRQRIVLIILSISLIVITGLLYLIVRSQPQTLRLQAPHGLVIIHFNRYGIPQIDATKNDLDAFYALGYLHARDRLWQMELQRRIARGTLSALFGKKAIKMDEYLRTWGFYRAAVTAWPALDHKAQAIINSYTAGVNAYIKTGAIPLPLRLLHDKPKLWTAIDTIAWGKVMAWKLTSSWREKIRNTLIVQQFGRAALTALAPAYPRSAPTTLSSADLIQAGLIGGRNHKQSQTQTTLPPHIPNAELTQLLQFDKQLKQELKLANRPGMGSNSWVVSGKLTETGKPILANDIHLEFSSPNTWYFAQLNGPHLHVTGVTLPGSPAIVIGHNRHIAWGLTNVYPDVQDLYIEPANAPLRKIAETIQVKGQKPVHYQIEISLHGPIISNITPAGKIGPKIAVQWTALLPGDTTSEAFIQLDYAHNWQQFTTALSHLIAPAQNVLYADTQGNIGYYLAGEIPIRHGWSGRFPVSNDATHEWSGYIPFTKLPHVYNPPEGFIASANNKAVPNSYPYKITFRWRIPPYRIARIINLLKQQAKITIALDQKIQLDTISEMWKQFAPYLLRTQPLDNNSRIALQILKQWRGNMSLSSNAATIFAFWYRALNQMEPASLKKLTFWTEPLFIVHQLQHDGRFCRQGRSKNCNDFLRHSLAQAMRALVKTLGANPKKWQWQRVHIATFQDYVMRRVSWIAWLFNRSIPTPGGLFTVNAGTYSRTSFNQIAGASYRQIIDLSNLNRSQYILPLGQSGNPLSSHYADMLPLWRNGQYLSLTPTKGVQPQYNIKTESATSRKPVTLKARPVSAPS